MAGCTFTPTMGFFVLLVLGAYGLAGLIFNIIDLSNTKNFHGEKWPLNHRPAFACFVVGQCGILLACLIGMIAATRKAILVFYVTTYILFGVFSLMIIIGGFCLREAMKDVSHEVLFALQKGTAEDYAWINSIQWEHNCCGVVSFMDWQLFTGAPNLDAESVPSSCCMKTISVPPNDCGVGVLKAHRPIEELQSIINMKGCGEKLSEYHKASLTNVGIEMLVAGGICFLVALFFYIGVTRTIYLDLYNDPENSQSGGASGLDANNNPCASHIGDGQGIGAVDVNGNTSNTRAGHYLDPNFRPSLLFKGKPSKSLGRDQPVPDSQNANTPKGTIFARLRSRSRKRKHSKSNKSPVTRRKDKMDPEVRRKFDMEMLYNPEFTFSTVSTTPHPSFSHNYDFDYTIEGEEPRPRPNFMIDNKNAMAPGLVHHSSLPEVHVLPHPHNNFQRHVAPFQKIPKTPIPNIPVSAPGTSSSNLDASGTTTVSPKCKVNFEIALAKVGVGLDPIAEESRNRIEYTSSSESTVSSTVDSQHQVQAMNSSLIKLEKISEESLDVTENESSSQVSMETILPENVVESAPDVGLAVTVLVVDSVFGCEAPENEDAPAIVSLEETIESTDNIVEIVDDLKDEKSEVEIPVGDPNLCV